MESIGTNMWKNMRLENVMFSFAVVRIYEIMNVLRLKDGVMYIPVDTEQYALIH